MLTTRLEQIWETSTNDEQISAKAQSRKILGNLVHYPTSTKRNYYSDDVEYLAAELLAWRKS